MQSKELRDKDKVVLELKNRRKIFILVEKTPGIHIRKLERLTKLPYGTLTYHLNYLVKNKLLIEKKHDKNLRYFIRGTSSEDSRLLGLLRQNSIRRILLLLMTEKKAHHKNIVDFVKLSPSTVSFHLNKLVKLRVINKEKDGFILNVDKDRLIKLLLTYRRTFFDSLVDRTIEMWDVR